MMNPTEPLLRGAFCCSKNRLQVAQNCIGHLVGAEDGQACLREVGGAGAVVQCLFDRFVDGVGFGGQVERIFEHHRRREDGRDGVGNVLAGDGRRGAVDGLVESARRVVDAGGGQNAYAADALRREVGENVAKQVAGDDDVEL